MAEVARVPNSAGLAVATDKAFDAAAMAGLTVAPVILPGSTTWDSQRFGSLQVAARVDGAIARDVEQGEKRVMNVVLVDTSGVGSYSGTDKRAAYQRAGEFGANLARSNPDFDVKIPTGMIVEVPVHSKVPGNFKN